MHQKGAEWCGVLVRDVMVKNPKVADPFMDVDQLRRLMVNEHMRYLPVMDGYTLQGVISFHDVAKAVLEEQSFENRMLKAYIRDWPEGEEPTVAKE
jgi:CBS domain-containing protein